MKKLLFIILALILIPHIVFSGTTMSLTTPWSKGVAVRLVDRSVTVHGENGLILMEVEDSFLNLSSVQCEGLYRFTLPVGAFAAGFWINTDGKEWVKGEVREVTEARKIYHEITSRMVDPGLLEQKDGEIVIRVFPVERNARVGVRFRCYFPAQSENGDYRILLPLNFSLSTSEGGVNSISGDSINFRLAAAVRDLQGIDRFTCNDERARVAATDAGTNVKLEFAASDLNDIELSYSQKNKQKVAMAFYQVPEGNRFSLLRIAGNEFSSEKKELRLGVIIDASGSMGSMNRARVLKLCDSLSAAGNNSIQIFILNENGLQKASRAELAEVEFFGPTRWKQLDSFSAKDFDGVVLVTDGENLTQAFLKELWLKAGHKPVRVVYSGIKYSSELANISDFYGGCDFMAPGAEVEPVAADIIRAIALNASLYDGKDSRYLPLYGNLSQMAFYVLPYRAGKYQVKDGAGKSLLALEVPADQQFATIAPWFVSIAARQQIRTLESMEQSEAVIKKITELGIRYSQATDYTAFLAVPESIARANADIMNPAYLAMFAAPNFRKARQQARVKACYANQRVLQGALEMYMMDTSDPGKLEFDLESGHINMDELVRAKYLKSHLVPPTENCEYRILGDPFKDGVPFCVVHGSVEDGATMSVEEMVKKYCEEHNLNSDDFDIPYHLYGSEENNMSIWELMRKYDLLQMLLALLL
ncbi:MAG: hypothetical protein CVV42_02490 [Candidatus Riflebacteria bacterium HGW-Riflebacteria-2]|jgi:hypothetical protein|nr:MAG: hypothetical protein CVV42_02490 [Candidatus Riflebacteria bacterium HGW-Riflebacteria-2]